MPVKNKSFKKILSIAGGDSSGNAGIGADIKTATALKTYTATAITCVTAQDDFSVRQILCLKNNLIENQILSVLDTIKIDAIKIGMLGNERIVKLVSKILKNKAKNIPIILDPILKSGSGSNLLTKQALVTLKKELIPLTFLITPNIFEAEVLSGIKIKNFSDVEAAAKKLLNFGAENILIKGGHFKSKNKKIYHLLLNKNGQKFIFSNKKIEIENARGTGCTLSSSIACFIAKNYPLEIAIKKSNQFVYKSIRNGEKINKDNLRLNHFYC